MDMTKEQLREVVLSDDPLEALEILTSGWIPLEHAVLAGNLIVSAGRLREARETRKPEDSRPEHRQLDEAVGAAIEAAEVAFEAALNAAYQLVWLSENCDCAHCHVRHQRQNAEQQ